MALKAYLESLGCGIPLQSDSLSDAATASLFSTPSGNLSDYIARMARLNANLVSGDGNSIVLNNNANSGPSVRSSSLVTDANSPLIDASHFDRGGSTNMDSHLDLPSSPLAFSPNNFSGLVVDASSQEESTSSPQDQNSQIGTKRLCRQLQMGGVTTSRTTSQAQGGSHPGKIQEPVIFQMSKKPRLDRNQENILHQKIIQQLLQKKDPMVIQDHNELLQALLQQHKIRNQQQQPILHSVPEFVGVPTQQQQQARHHLQQQANHHISAIHPHDDGICSQRLMQYIYHLRHRPPDNSIAYWRKVVGEYFAPGAKERWCLSLYDSIGGHALGVFSRSAMEWHCDICGSKSGKGFEAIFEILPRLSKIKFESGVIDELLFLDFPHEVRFPSGLMMLRYGKAVQESVYEQFRVVREGQLRIIFSSDLKILSWEFCARHHEELVPRSLVAPQVNQLIEAAKRCQSTTTNGRSNGISSQYLRSSCNVFVKAGRQLTGNLELLLVNDLGFSKRYVRCFQIAEVVNIMQELMTFSRDNKIGPMESLRTYPRKGTTTNVMAKQMHETVWLTSAEVSPGSSNNMNEYSGMTKDEITTGSEKAGLAAKQERSCSINSSIHTAIPLPILGPQSFSPRVIQSSPISNFSTSQLSQDREDQNQRMIQKLLQEMVYNSRAKRVQNANTKVKEEVLKEYDGNAVGTLSTRAWEQPANVLGSTLGRNDHFKAGSNGNPSGVCGDNTIIKRETDILEQFHSPKAVRKMDYEFFKNGVLNDDWKA